MLDDRDMRIKKVLKIIHKHVIKISVTYQPT